jgi:RNA polymerase sigma-70 factor (ECF subfamily)
VNENDLIQRMKQGDENAFRILVEKHSKPIFHLCFRYLNNAEDAEEVAQDVFIKLQENITSYEPRAKLSTYLYRIAVNRSLNKIRDRKVKKWVSLEHVPSVTHESNSFSKFNPDDMLELKEKQQAVRKAIDTLPGNQRTAVLLHRFQGLSYTEIAEVMQCSVSAVESRLFRAKQSLSKKLQNVAEQ